jgi:aminocarboxymuconate-semialdehyde decarboxylase
VNILVLHAGGFFPYQAGRLRHARTVRPELANAPDDPWEFREQIFFDCITHDPEALRFLLRKVGLGQVVLGTDSPFDMGTPDPIGDLSAAVGARGVEAIADSNPALLFDI